MGTMARTADWTIDFRIGGGAIEKCNFECTPRCVKLKSFTSLRHISTKPIVLKANGKI